MDATSEAPATRIPLVYAVSSEASVGCPSVGAHVSRPTVQRHTHDPNTLKVKVDTSIRAYTPSTFLASMITLQRHFLF